MENNESNTQRNKSHFYGLPQHTEFDNPYSAMAYCDKLDDVMEKNDELYGKYRESISDAHTDRMNGMRTEEEFTVENERYSKQMALLNYEYFSVKELFEKKRRGVIAFINGNNTADAATEAGGQQTVRRIDASWENARENLPVAVVRPDAPIPVAQAAEAAEEKNEEILEDEDEPEEEETAPPNAEYSAGETWGIKRQRPSTQEEERATDVEEKQNTADGGTPDADEDGEDKTDGESETVEQIRHSYDFRKNAIEENVEIVALRMRYETEKLRDKYDAKLYTLTQDQKENERDKKEISEKMSDIAKKTDRAKKLEEAVNRRYYMCATDKFEGNPKKREKNKDKIREILSEFNSLLTERDKINEKLIALYKRENPKSNETFADYSSYHALKVAKASYKAQKKSAKILRKYHAPQDLKDKIFNHMNEKTKCKAKIEYNKRRIKKAKLKGLEKKILKQEIKENRKKVKTATREIRQSMRLAEKYDVEHKELMKKRFWVVFFLIAILGISVMVILYVVFRDSFGI